MSVYKNDKLEYVIKAIDSVLNQSIRPNQYVIMIDGPIDDKLKKILLEYEKKDKIIELYFREENKGLGITLNEGLNNCKYEYVARMDADDESCKNRFEEQLKILLANINIDVVGCNVLEYDENMKRVLCEKRVPQYSEEIKKFAEKRNPINHPTVMFKKSAILDCGSYEDCRYFEDYYLWVKLLKNGYSFYNIQKPLYKFRAGKTMYERRGGIAYINCIKNFEFRIYKMGYINLFMCINNIIKRSVVALLPNNIRTFLYLKKLRKDKKITGDIYE